MYLSPAMTMITMMPTLSVTMIVLAPGEPRAERGDQQRQRDRGSRVVCGDRAGEHENARAYGGAEANGDERPRAQHLLQSALALGRRIDGAHGNQLAQHRRLGHPRVRTLINSLRHTPFRFLPAPRGVGRGPSLSYAYPLRRSEEHTSELQSPCNLV